MPTADQLYDQLKKTVYAAVSDPLDRFVIMSAIISYGTERHMEATKAISRAWAESNKRHAAMPQGDELTEPCDTPPPSL